MSPTISSILEQAQDLEKRYNCYYDGGPNCYYSPWYTWGRFVVLGAAILVILIGCMVCACITARRRRARGAQPYYGTGWMANNHGPVNYYGNQGGFGGAPPQYQYGANNDYYNRGPGPQQETGVELQSPPQAAYQNTYQQPGEPVYQPPAGPPPGKW